MGNVWSKEKAFGQYHTCSFQESTRQFKYNHIPDLIKACEKILEQLMNRFFHGRLDEALADAKKICLEKTNTHLEKLEDGEGEGDSGCGLYLILDPALLPFDRLPTLAEFIVAVIYGGRGQASRLHDHFGAAAIILTDGDRSKDPQFVEFFMARIVEAGGNVIGISRGGLTDSMSKHLEACELSLEYDEENDNFPLLTNLTKENALSLGINKERDAATAILHVFEPFYEAFLPYWREEFFNKCVNQVPRSFSMLPVQDDYEKNFLQYWREYPVRRVGETLPPPPILEKEKSQYADEKPEREQKLEYKKDEADIRKQAAKDPNYKEGSAETKRQIEQRVRKAIEDKRNKEGKKEENRLEEKKNETLRMATQGRVTRSRLANLKANNEARNRRSRSTG